ncbi:hypothetical protein N865_04725 [Intrasporangium oryzae NRRL B-24470]|uniref:Uncharacterized protein n=1 Tax=Intrasporangium oryzae NRRL B-24470 TaxID=1386089 RepID=W9G983_9MICO|nr:hypothetical protein [Intrasporangium oryzae]EWT02751.1 hypothetical protein N865_04725 [Intrasporangium oryzae NRRL B-24470]
MAAGPADVVTSDGTPTDAPGSAAEPAEPAEAAEAPGVDPRGDVTRPLGGSPSVLQEVPAVLRVLGQVVAPATLITAVLIFFGWSRTAALFGWFGVDPTSLGFSSTDYLLTSQDGLFVPGVVIALLVLVMMWVLALVRRSGRPSPLSGPWVGPAAAVGGLALTTNGLLGVFGRGVLVDRLCVAPLCLIAGVALLSLAAHTVRSRRLTYSRGAGVAEITALTIVMAMALFWAAGDYSAAVGRQRATEIAAGLHARPHVVLYSDRSLGITARGVRAVRCVGGDAAAYGFRYSGLVLLLNSEGQYVFLPAGWTRSAGSAIAVPKRDGIRLDYRSAGATDGALPATC